MPPRQVSPFAATALLAFLTLATFEAPRAAADCLASQVRCGTDTYATSGATYAIHCSNMILGVAGVEFNVPARTFHLYNDTEDGAELFLNDEFVVHGPAAGTPISLHLRIRYHGTIASFGVGGGGNGAVGAAPLAPEPGDPAAVEKTFGHASDPATSGYPASFADSVDLVLARTAETPIGVGIHGLVQNGYSDQLYAEIVMIDLPPGYSVTSCKGYLQEQPVPALPVSWGKVKAAYR